MSEGLSIVGGVSSGTIRTSIGISINWDATDEEVHALIVRFPLLVGVNVKS